jgi:hypothetical protein
MAPCSAMFSSLGILTKIKLRLHDISDAVSGLMVLPDTHELTTWWGGGGVGWGCCTLMGSQCMRGRNTVAV